MVCMHETMYLHLPASDIPFLNTVAHIVFEESPTWFITAMNTRMEFNENARREAFLLRGQTDTLNSGLMGLASPWIVSATPNGEPAMFSLRLGEETYSMLCAALYEIASNETFHWGATDHQFRFTSQGRNKASEIYFAIESENPALAGVFEKWVKPA